MNLLVSRDGFSVEPDPKLFMIYPFDKLLDSRVNDKDTLLKELGYIYFCYNPESDFMDQVVLDLRKIDVRKYLSISINWKEDELIQDCIKVYVELTKTSASELLEIAKIGVNKLKIQINDINLDERDPKTNKPIWDFKKYQETIGRLPDTLESLLKAEKMYIRNKEENTKLKGDKTKSIYEDM